MATILMTGGAGYLGSHAAVHFLEAGYDVLALDNLSNSSEVVFARIAEITGKQVDYYLGDIVDGALLDQIFEAHSIEGVIHFAGLKAVGDSVADPLAYYANNVSGSVCLFEAMRRHNCKRLVFSSSATVYGDPGVVAYTEDLPLHPVNPYGHTKRAIEDILRDLYRSEDTWALSLLRYFNPVGAHPSGLIGEDPQGIPNNLMPYIAKVAIGELDHLKIFGNDYPTSDGTGVRDYIHVEDLAAGHLIAYQALAEGGCDAYNLGTGRGYSVLQAVDAFSRVSGTDIPYRFMPRREGDLAEYYAVPEYAAEKLGWIAEFNLEDMVRDHWNWQKSNPRGYV